MVEVNGRGPGIWASVFPGIWSFMVAARARGLGTVLTTYHLAHEEEAAAPLGILPRDRAGGARARRAYEGHELPSRSARPARGVPLANVVTDSVPSSA
jgi:hypothetical protein